MRSSSRNVNGRRCYYWCGVHYSLANAGPVDLLKAFETWKIIQFDIPPRSAFASETQSVSLRDIPRGKCEETRTLFRRTFPCFYSLQQSNSLPNSQLQGKKLNHCLGSPNCILPSRHYVEHYLWPYVDSCTSVCAEGRAFT